MRKSDKNINFLDLIPERNIGYEIDDSGIVTILKEKSRNRLLKKMISVFNKDQFIRIHLDETGSLVWKKIGEKKDIYQICNEIIKESEVEIPQLEHRVSYFFSMMKKNGFVQLNKKAGK